MLAETGVSPGQLDTVIRDETEELERRVAAYRGQRPAVDLVGCTALVVDDGFATGFTARAAIAADVVCLVTVDRLGGVGVHYADFSQTSDAEVRRLLDAAAGAT